MEQFYDFIKGAIKKQLENEIDKIYEEEVKIMNEKFEKRKNEIIAGTVLNITKEIQMEKMQDNLILTIRKE